VRTVNLTRGRTLSTLRTDESPKVFE